MFCSSDICINPWAFPHVLKESMLALFPIYDSTRLVDSLVLLSAVRQMLSELLLGGGFLGSTDNAGGDTHQTANPRVWSVGRESIKVRRTVRGLDGGITGWSADA